MIVKLDAEDLRGLVESVVKSEQEPVRLTVEGLRRIIREEAESMVKESEDIGAKVKSYLETWAEGRTNVNKETLHDLASDFNDEFAADFDRVVPVLGDLKRHSNPLVARAAEYLDEK